MRMTIILTSFQRTLTVVAIAFATSVLGLALIVPFYANAALTQTLDLGDSNAEVTELQTYLSTNSSYYPSGLVTGYFGELTKAGVERFQTANGIVTSGTPATTGYGRVGPLTLARINSILGSGNTGGGNVSWDSVPMLSEPTVSVTNSSATISWTTNEQTVGQVYWSAIPLTLSEATGPRQQPYVSGTLATNTGTFQTSHSVTVSNLQSNSTYYFIVRGVDSVGNMSMVWPRSFKTN